MGGLKGTNEVKQSKKRLNDIKGGRKMKTENGWEQTCKQNCLKQDENEWDQKGMNGTR